MGFNGDRSLASPNSAPITAEFFFAHKDLRKFANDKLS
jgi:hypothetical protein